MMEASMVKAALERDGETEKLLQELKKLFGVRSTKAAIRHALAMARSNLAAKSDEPLITGS
jgi:hypothetical protein